jgi:hypothetical protein
MELLAKLSANDAFRVVMSRENAHLFRKAADGAYKPFLHNGKHFVENVDLMRVPPDYVDVLSNIAFMANMAALAAKLDAIEAGIRNLARILTDTQRGRVKGALDALAVAQALLGPGERRSQTISAAHDVVTELGALAGQLRGHIAAMPEEKTGLLDGWLKSGVAEAKAAYAEVRDDIALLIVGLRYLARAYQHLGEISATREAISRVLDRIAEAGLPEAIRKSRLMPFRAAAPELYFGSFLDAVTAMRGCLLSIERIHRPLIAIDVRAAELLN